MFSDDYASIISDAIAMNEVKNFCETSLIHSLSEIGIRIECQQSVLSILEGLSKADSSSGSSLSASVAEFQTKWRPHLDRAYSNEYESSRWKFFQKFVFIDNHADGAYGRFLDVGCGRGCISEKIAENNLARSVIGIDAVDFSAEWNERTSRVQQKMDFYHIKARLSEWANDQAPFDTILLSYVLHHSSESAMYSTLSILKRMLKPDGKLFILEDALSINSDPIEDPRNLCQVWSEWVGRSQVYPLSVSFGVQIVLDFVAVQLLANFRNVAMPCNYKTASDWKLVFERLGFTIESELNIGFPPDRDIEVPQCLFIIRPPS